MESAGSIGYEYPILFKGLFNSSTGLYRPCMDHACESRYIWDTADKVYKRLVWSSYERSG